VTRSQVSALKRTVLITGASGFIGKHLVRALAASGWAVRAASRDPEAIPARSGTERVALPDLGRPADWSKLTEDVTHIVHLAGIAHAPGTLPDEVYTRINTDAVGELAHAAPGQVERFVLMSSVRAQAGLAADQVITETDAAKPTDPYGRSKLAAERLLKESGVPFTVLRPTAVYGKGVKGNIASLATLAQTPMPLPFGGLDNRRSLLALENLASAIELVLTSREAEGETFLAADSEPISVAELVAAMREGLGRAPHLMRVPRVAVKRLMATFGKEAEWERLSGNFVIDAAKLRGIGWVPRIKTPKGIAAMMRASGTNGASPAD
jgi:nucleoside-diphosphate-sugar epimerase